MLLGKINAAVLRARCFSPIAQQTSGCGFKRKKNLKSAGSLFSWVWKFIPNNFRVPQPRIKILAAKWFPSLTPGTPTHLWNVTRRCWNLQILLLLRVQEMFPKNHIAWFPTSQPSVRKHEKPKWLEFLIIANSYMRAGKLKMQSNLSLCKTQAANVIPVASFLNIVNCFKKNQNTRKHCPLHFSCLTCYLLF